jgi:hypothetical protein
MATIIVKTKVADFSAWQRAFDSNDGARKAYGWKSHTIARDPSDPQAVIVVSHVGSLEQARAFLQDPAVRANMAGATALPGPPDVQFLEDWASHTY